MKPRRLNLLIILPPLLFFGFAAAAYFGLKRENPDELPSALVGRTAPLLSHVEPFGDMTPVTDADLSGPGLKLVNFWASWCGPCRAEHPLLMDLNEGGIPVIGINYKDTPANAEGFLAELGNPYDLIAADTSGRTGIDWGIYGVPETFLVGADGEILVRFPGPLTRDAFAKRLQPVIDANN